MSKAIVVFFGLLLTLSETAFTQNTTLTSTMTPQQFTNCGLQKLNSAELAALNDWIGTLASVKSLSTAKQHAPASEDEIALYDNRGSATAYIDTTDENTIYLWNGKPVGYLDEENIYGFNGKHLAWFKDGKVMDHQGRIAGTTAEEATVVLQGEPFKGFKEFKPFKAFEEFAPLEPLTSLSASRLPLGVLLAQGEK